MCIKVQKGAESTIIQFSIAQNSVMGSLQPRGFITSSSRSRSPNTVELIL